MDIFKKLGLKKYESEIYLSLLNHGKNDAHEISKNSGVPITAVYPNLQTLIEKGLINKINGKISHYEALDPEIAIKSYLKKRSKELEDIEKESIDYLKSIPRIKREGRKEIIWLSEGKDFSKEYYLKAMSLAKKTFYILGWRFEKIGDKYNLLKEFKLLKKRNVDVKIILTGKRNKATGLVEDYIEESIPLRYLPLDNFSIFVRDEEECKITLKDRELPTKFNVNIKDPSLSKAMKQYFLDSWDKAEELV